MGVGTITVGGGSGAAWKAGDRRCSVCRGLEGCGSGSFDRRDFAIFAGRTEEHGRVCELPERGKVDGRGHARQDCGCVLVA